MGNAFSEPEGFYHQFIGRQRDIRKAFDILESKKVLTLCGTFKSGKSRLASKISQDLVKKGEKCIVCELDNDVSDVEKELCHMISEKLNKEITDLNFDEIVNVLKNERKCYVFIDSVDPIMRSKIKDSFLNFVVKVARKCPELKLVLVATDKPKFTFPSYVVYVLPPMLCGDLVTLIHEVTENKFMDQDGNKMYIRNIAKLCEGSPHAATMAGCLLKEDSGFLKPSDLVQIMIYRRFECLSPDNYPLEDKMEAIKGQIECLAEDDRYKELSKCLEQCARMIPDTDFTVDEAFQHNQDKKASKALFKLKVLKKMLDRNILTTEDGDRLQLSGLLKECALILSLETNDEAGIADEVLSRVITKYNVRRLELDLSDDCLGDTKAIEALVNSMVQNMETQDCKLVEVDEDQVATTDAENHQEPRLTLVPKKSDETEPQYRYFLTSDVPSVSASHEPEQNHDAISQDTVNNTQRIPKTKTDKVFMESQLKGSLQAHGPDEETAPVTSVTSPIQEVGDEESENIFFSRESGPHAMSYLSVHASIDPSDHDVNPPTGPADHGVNPSVGSSRSGQNKNTNISKYHKAAPADTHDSSLDTGSKASSTRSLHDSD